MKGQQRKRGEERGACGEDVELRRVLHAVRIVSAPTQIGATVKRVWAEPGRPSLRADCLPGWDLMHLVIATHTAGYACCHQSVTQLQGHHWFHFNLSSLDVVPAILHVFVLVQAALRGR